MDVSQITNAQLKKIVERIEIDKDGNVEIFLRLLGDLGLSNTVLIPDNKKAAVKSPAKQPDDEPTKNALNLDNRT